MGDSPQMPPSSLPFYSIMQPPNWPPLPPAPQQPPGRWESSWLEVVEIRLAVTVAELRRLDLGGKAITG